MIGFFDPSARWAFVLGAALGGAPLYWLGYQVAFLQLSRAPLRRVAAAYRELFADIVHLCATGELRPGR